MTTRVRVLLLCALAAASTLSARVISYAPYTNRTSIPSFHYRAGRYFALAEAPPTESPSVRAQVVLYDALGLEEPRVIWPSADESRWISFVAVYESRFLNGSSVPNIPAILIGAWDVTPTTYMPYYVLSVDGGKTFTRLNQLDGAAAIVASNFPDTGGPYSHGLWAGVVIGDEFMFVVNTSRGIYGIGSNGVKQLTANTATLLGRDRNGQHFLARSGSILQVIDVNGNSTPIGEIPIEVYPLYGWVTSDGSAYLQSTSTGTQTLFLYRNGQRTVVGFNPGTSVLPPPPYYSNDLSFFGVPTSDYEGAWMIQRESGKATTLSRHTIASGTEVFWSDVSGPQVEALHTGLSPNTLLIQVHRARAQAERWFLDPALAVWHVGEPAPRAYDELFLNETTSKGFVHLNVDAVADGDPFVFDSGAQPTGGIITSPAPPPAGGGGDVMQEWGVVRASLRQRLVLPGVARQAGAFGSYWLTDVVVQNPLDTPQNVDFRFVALGEVQAAVVHQKTLTLAAHEIRVIKDVLKSLFDLEQGGGVLHIEPTSGVTATARTYTRSGEGSFGFGMQAIDLMNAASPRFPVTFAGAFPGPEYRTNMLLTDTSGRGTEARLRAHGVSGLIGVDDVAFSAPNNGVEQMNGLAGSLGLTITDAGGLTVQPTRGTMIVTVVAMDNRTNDPTFFPPDLPAPVVRTIPVIGHVDGANNSKFRSDLFLLNPSTSPRTVTLEARLWDAPQSVRTVPFTLLPGEARVVRDALPTLFGVTGVARLRYNAGGLDDGVRVTSRTYNVTADGATYGCLVPPLNSFQSAGPGEKLEILGIVGGTGFRTNVGLVDLSPNPVAPSSEARIHIVDETGKEIDQFSITLPAASGTQINDIFHARGIDQPAAAMVYVEVIKGLIGAYATLTDNVTNDSTYLGANLSASN